MQEGGLEEEDKQHLFGMQVEKVEEAKEETVCGQVGMHHHKQDVQIQVVVVGALDRAVVAQIRKAALA